ncbi:transporter substrate-binding domain-containing protein [Polaromonas sp.]|uniref:transporter substrate-binding domain-containing protein n=1 Tax=Polaromonas sp. TaxID=1869339 RepID=UPI0013BB2B29|nr:transporter substrate-binding domain-containing protein [Polaromonas sp.]NDP61538.1 transporter substrate-binding domain-containing protein [Polaromonas sp.]
MKFKLCAAMLTLAASAALPAFAADWTVGANVGNVPWEFQDASGKIVGFEIDLVNEAARRAGKSVQIENIPFNGLFSAVQSGRIQIAVSSITITPKRLESVAFAQPYYDSDQSLSVLKATKINSLEDTAGKTIGVDTGSTGDMYATQNTAKYKIATITRYEGLAPAMLDLAARRIDGYISDIPAVEYYIKDKPQYRIAARIPTGERYSFMTAKNWPEAARLNDILTEMKKDGFVSKTHQKWFGSVPPADSSTVKVMDVPKL